MLCYCDLIFAGERAVPSKPHSAPSCRFLSRRTSNGHQHEAMRKMQLEFMQHWDGLRTKATDRVLVLAATNRPMDLDDAVIRRMPRRILVPLPDVPNREKILKVILKDENLDPGLDIADVAQQTDGYSGSDLKNLCIAAAYCPVRDLLDSERAAASQAGDSKPASDAHTPSLRPITKKDFEAAMSQVTASTHAESATMADLKRWNDQFGEGGSRRSEQLAYYT